MSPKYQLARDSQKLLQVRESLLKTVDGVHRSANANEVARNDAAARFEQYFRI